MHYDAVYSCPFVVLCFELIGGLCFQNLVAYVFNQLVA